MSSLFEGENLREKVRITKRAKNGHWKLFSWIEQTPKKKFFVICKFKKFLNVCEKIYKKPHLLFKIMDKTYCL